MPSILSLSLCLLAVDSVRSYLAYEPYNIYSYLKIYVSVTKLSNATKCSRGHLLSLL